MEQSLKVKKPKKQLVPEASPLIAKRAFVICQNEYFREIKEGDDLSDIPVRYHPNLKTEGVL